MPWAPWFELHRWSPFKIDALGLVTLLGAEEINAAVGRLVRSSYLEYLPLLGAFVIAGDRFREKAAGFNLYNITQGIHTTDLSGWLTRWMLSQDFETTRSFVVWTVTPPVDRTKDTIIAALISFVFNGFLVAGTILSKDWYGLGNALAMVTSIAVRAYIMSANRQGIDKMIDEAMSFPALQMSPDSYEHKLGLYNNEKKALMQRKKMAKKEKCQERVRRKSDLEDLDSEKGKSTSMHETALRSRRREHPKPCAGEYPNESWTGNETVKVVVIMSDSKAVTMWLPKELVIPPSVFVENPRILHHRRYDVARWIGWLAFAVHIIAIGMADLASQLYTVTLIVVPTVLIVWKTGCDDSKMLAKKRQWKDKAFHNQYLGSNVDPENASDGEFQKMRECWIGSRLKAEVFEWPASYEFNEVKDAEGKVIDYYTQALSEDVERSKKRMDLYAWLQLSTSEEYSMDKWDLFPHIRGGNNKWWINYKMKKHAVKPNPNFGPQKPTPATTTDPSAPDDDYNIRPIEKKDRTKTTQFNLPNQSPNPSSSKQSPSKNTGSQGPPSNSAFPASMNANVSRVDEGTEPANSPAVAAPPIIVTTDSAEEAHNAGEQVDPGRLQAALDSRAPDAESAYRV